MRTRIWHIRLREWFPPEDPISIAVATLCILRQDYMIDMHGMSKGWGNAVIGENQATKGFSELDENSTEWRRIYFWRNSLRTLREIGKLVRMLYEHHGEALSKEPEDLRQAFSALYEEMETAKVLVRELRNKIGGHVKYAAIKEGLESLPDDLKSLMQIGDITGKIHYRFVGEITLSTMLPGVPEDEKLGKLDDILKETAKLIPVLGKIDEIVALYAKSRRLS